MYALKPMTSMGPVRPDPSIIYPLKPYNESAAAPQPATSKPAPSEAKTNQKSGGDSAPAKGGGGKAKTSRPPAPSANPPPAAANFDPAKALSAVDALLARLADTRIVLDAMRDCPPPPREESLEPVAPKPALKAAKKSPAAKRSGGGGAAGAELLLKAPPSIAYGAWLWLLLPEIRKAQPGLRLRVFGHSQIVPELQERFRFRPATESGPAGSEQERVLSLLWKADLDEWSLSGGETSPSGWLVAIELIRLAKVSPEAEALAARILLEPGKGLEELGTALGFQWEWALNNGGFCLGEMVLALAVLCLRWEGKALTLASPVQAWLNRCLNAAGPDFARFRYPLMPTGF